MGILKCGGSCEVENGLCLGSSELFCKWSDRVNSFIYYTNLTGSVMKLCSGTYTTHCCETSAKFQDFIKNGDREVSKNLVTVSRYLRRKFPLLEILSIIAHTVVFLVGGLVGCFIFYTYPRGFNLCVRDRKIYKKNYWPSHIRRLVWTLDRE